LPELTFEHPYFWQVVGQINVAVRDRLGLDVTTLRCRSNAYDAVRDQTRLVYELECHGSTKPDASVGSWIGPEVLDELPPDQRPILAAWFSEQSQSASPAYRVPWYHPGWRHKMLSWVNGNLAQSGRTLTGAVEQVRSWERAAIWRAPTNLGTIYFKAVPSMFGHEPALTALLAERFTNLIPHVLAFDAEQRWLLMADAGNQRLMDDPAIDHWNDALRDYAGMQIMLANHVDTLHAVGVPYRGLTWLRSGLQQLFADEVTLAQGPACLSPDEVVALRALQPALLAASTILEQSDLPLSLEHGDLSAWQVQLDGTNHWFLDWSDSSVAPPFFSLLGVLSDSPVGLPGVLDATSQLRDAYLSQWTEIAPLDVYRMCLWHPNVSHHCIMR
jgi:hypothetical protein